MASGQTMPWQALAESTCERGHDEMVVNEKDIDTKSKSKYQFQNM
jgi:hypothetical protein